MRLPHWILSLVLLAFTAMQTVQAAPRYNVEIIVFQNYALKGWTEEFWPETHDSVTLENSTSELSRQIAPLFISEAYQQIDHLEDRLKSAGYGVVYHTAWQQNAVNKRSTATTRFEGGSGGTSVLGTLRLVKTKFEHIYLDMELSRVIPEKVRLAFAEQHKLHVDALPRSWNFKISEHRKIKPKEVHYIDHPLFGALVRITEASAN